jgi:hypothetical protein
MMNKSKLLMMLGVLSILTAIFLCTGPVSWGLAFIGGGLVGYYGRRVYRDH